MLLQISTRLTSNIIIKHTLNKTQINHKIYRETEKKRRYQKHKSEFSFDELNL